MPNSHDPSPPGAPAYAPVLVDRAPFPPGPRAPAACTTVHSAGASHDTGPTVVNSLVSCWVTPGGCCTCSDIADRADPSIPARSNTVPVAGVTGAATGTGTAVRLSRY